MLRGQIPIPVCDVAGGDGRDDRGVSINKEDIALTRFQLSILKD